MIKRNQQVPLPFWAMSHKKNPDRKDQWIPFEFKPIAGGSLSFVLQRVPGDGNCQFHSLSRACTTLGLSANELRLGVSKHISRMKRDEFERELGLYRLEVDNRDFAGSWSPYQCHSPGELADYVRAPCFSHKYFDFQGDFFTLRMFAQAYRYRVIVFLSPYGSSPVVIENSERQGPFIILLFHSQMRHYEPVGIPCDCGCVVTEFAHIPPLYKSLVLGRS